LQGGKPRISNQGDEESMNLSIEDKSKISKTMLRKKSTKLNIEDSTHG